LDNPTNWGAIIAVIVIVQVVFAVASGFVAHTKNRDVLAYVLGGFFFGIIGLIVAAAVPKQEPQTNKQDQGQTASLAPIKCKYTQQINVDSKLTDGSVYQIKDRIRFIPYYKLLAPETTISDGFEIPISDIELIEYFPGGEVPNDVPSRDQIWKYFSLIKITLRDETKPQIGVVAKTKPVYAFYERLAAKLNKGGKGGEETDQ
jgi:hypothetical protein